MAVDTNISLVAGETATLKCELYGYLPGNAGIEWRRDGQLISTDERHFISDSGGNRDSIDSTGSYINSIVTELMIASVQESDSGEYVCSLGGEMVQILLNVAAVSTTGTCK